MHPYLYKQLNIRILILLIWGDQVSHFDSGFVNIPSPHCATELRWERACSSKNLLTVLSVRSADCNNGLAHATSAWGAALFWFGSWTQLSGVQHALTVTFRPKLASKEEREELRCLLLCHLHSLHAHSCSLAFFVLTGFNHFSGFPVKNKSLTESPWKHRKEMSYFR